MVAGLADLKTVAPVLRRLGRAHQGYGVIPAHFAIVGQALLGALEAKLGADWTAVRRRLC